MRVGRTLLAGLLSSLAMLGAVAQTEHQNNPDQSKLDHSKLDQETNPRQWLGKMIQASRDANYEGRSVLISGGQIVSLAVYRARIDGQVWERVVHLNGPPAEIIRQGPRLISLDGNHATDLSTLTNLDQPLGQWDAMQKGLQNASEYYRFNVAGEDRVADRAAVKINVQPLDLHRYGYSLWLDVNSGILLRSQTHPRQGDPLEVFEFVDLTTGKDLTREDFSPDGDVQMPGATLAQEGMSERLELDGRWSVGWMPEGFNQTQYVGQNQQPGISIRAYSDGLAAFTVFYETRMKPVTESVRSRGATVAVNHNLEGSLVTVVGEIPADTARRIADSVKILAAAP